MNCKTCKHWKRHESAIGDPFPKSYLFGECLNSHFVYDDQSFNSNPVGQLPNADGLIYSDGEGYSAGFETGENFGCIHHEIK